DAVGRSLARVRQAGRQVAPACRQHPAGSVPSLLALEAFAAAADAAEPGGVSTAAGPPVLAAVVLAAVRVPVRESAHARGSARQRAAAAHAGLPLAGFVARGPAPPAAARVRAPPPSELARRLSARGEPPVACLCLALERRPRRSEP